MSNSPFDPNNPLFPWNLPPVAPKPPPPPTWLDLLRPAQPTPTIPSLADLLAQIQQPKRPRIFVSYHHDSDQPYYNEFSRIFHDTHETIYDNSLDDEIDSEDTDYTIQRIRDEYITGTSCTLVLVGPFSHQRKYIDWEIKATLDKQHGLIGVQLPNLPIQPNNTVIVPDRLHSNIKSGYALWLTWQQVIASADKFRQYVSDASNRPNDRIVNPRDIKKKNG